MALTAKNVEHAKPREKRYILKDDHGLYLEVGPKGGRWWRVRYWFDGRENRLSLGTFPVVDLREARDKCLEIKKQIAAGINPSQNRKLKKITRNIEHSSTFRKVAQAWLDKMNPTWSEGHAETVLQRLEANIFPLLGNVPIKAITSPHLLEVLRQIEKRGALEVTRRVRGICSQIFRYAIACGLADIDPAAPLVGALQSPSKKHHASLSDPNQIGKLLREIDLYPGSQVVLHAFKLTPLVITRPGELRLAEWREFDLDGSEWRIPPKHLKVKKNKNKEENKNPHIVPLSNQAVNILRSLYQITGRGRYAFPSMTSSLRPMSENTINMALRRIGFNKDEMTAHGFRSMASTLLNEQGWNRDAIERQLAHYERDAVRAAYNYAEYLPERKRMMQAWADYLDELKKRG